MTPKQEVLGKYLLAHIYREGKFTVRIKIDGGKVIGTGRNQSEAWADAARRIVKEQSK